MKYLYSVALAAAIGLVGLTPSTSEAGPIRRALFGSGYYSPSWGGYNNGWYGSSYYMPSYGYYDSSYYVAPSTSNYYPDSGYYAPSTSYYYPSTSYYYPGGTYFGSGLNGSYYNAPGILPGRPFLRAGALIGSGLFR
jgi:hypothetical protein